MKLEAIRNEKQKMIKENLKSSSNIKDKDTFCSGYKKGIDDSFNTFASYIDLFRRYKNNVKLLMNEQKDVWSKFVQYYESHSDIKNTDYLSRYNNWLFDYIFSGVNDEDSSEFLSL